MALTGHEPVLTGCQAVSWNGEKCPLNSSLEDKVGCLTQCEKVEGETWELTGPHPSPCAHSRKCLEMT